MPDHEVPIPVLLVDSFAARAERIAGLLGRMGFDAWRCTSPVEACRRAADGPCLALVALEDARRSGWSLLKLLSEDLAPRVPLVVLTEASPDAATREVLDRLPIRTIQLDERLADGSAGAEDGLEQGLATLLDSAGRELLLLDAADARANEPWLRELRAGGIRVHTACDARAVASHLACRPGGRPPELVVLRDTPSIVGTSDSPLAWSALTSYARCVVLAEHGDAERRAAWLRGGAAAYLVEPVEPSSLFVALGLRTPVDRVRDAVESAAAELLGEPDREPARPANLAVWVRADSQGRLREWNGAARARFGGGVEPPASWRLEDLMEERTARELVRDSVAGENGARPIGVARVRGEGDAELDCDLWPLEGGGWVWIGLGRQPAEGTAAHRSPTADAAESFLRIAADGTIETGVEEAPAWAEFTAGASFAERVAEVDRPTFRSALAEALSGAPSQLAHRWASTSGTEVWCQTRLFPIAGDTRIERVGALVRRVGLGLPAQQRDPHGDSAAHTLLEQGGGRLSELLTGAPAVLFDVDPTGRLVRREAHRRGADGAEGPGQGSVFEAFGDVPELVEMIRSALAGRGREASIEVSGRTLEIYVSAIRDAHGAISGAKGVALDVSDRVAAQTRFEAVVEATSSVVGQGFFRNLVRTLNRSLGVRLAYISSLARGEGPDHLRMLSLCAGSEYSEGYDYPVAGTPDELVLSDGRAYLPQGIHERFGENRWIRQQGVQSFLGVAIRDSGGEAIGVLGVMHTGPLEEQRETESMLRVFASRAGVELERLAREARIRESEARWRSVVENAPEVVATVDRGGRVLFANRTAADNDQPSWTDLLGEFEPAEFERALEHVFETGEARSVVLEARSAAGDPRWYDCRIGPMQTGVPAETAIVLATDTTAAKRAELGLAARARVEQWIREVSTRFINLDLEELDDGLAHALEQVAGVCGFERAYVFQLGESETALAKTHEWTVAGVPPFLQAVDEEQPLGLGWVLPRIRAGKDVYVPAVAGLGDEFQAEREQLLALGLCSFGAFPMAVGGRLLGMFGFDRLNGELVWDREMAALMRIVADVFASTLARKQEEVERRELEKSLRQANKLEAIGRLAGGIAHDFNQILMGVRGQAEILRGMFPQQPAPQGIAAVLDTAAERGAELTRKVLEFARTEPREGAPEPVCLHRIVEEVCGLLHSTFEKSIHLERELSATCSTLMGDRGALQQLVMNLCVNARDAMEQSGGELRISTSDFVLDLQEAHRFPELRPGRFVRLEVRDEGCGMDEETRERIFEPFFTTKGQGKGTGLGLSTAYGVVHEHGGTLRVESEPGQGTRFALWFPVEASAAGETDEPERVEPVVRGHGLVLVVDDEQIVRLTARGLLESIGYEVLLASNGLEAAELFSQRSEEIEVVLLDRIMPEMDGVACFHEMQKIDARVPIVLSSGYGYESARQDFPEEGLAGLITKPYPPLGEFSRVLSNAIAGRERDEEEAPLTPDVLQPEPKRPLSEHRARQPR